MRHQQPDNPQTISLEKIPKRFLAILSGILAISCVGLTVSLIEARTASKSLTEFHESDLNLNGFIEVLYMCGPVSDAHPSASPVGAYQYANEALEELSARKDLLSEEGPSKEKITNPNDVLQVRGIHPKVKIYLIPTKEGYKISILSSRELTDDERKRVDNFCQIEIQKAVAQWNAESWHEHQQAWIP